MTEWDAPNQQVVRPDASPPWEEGDGGSTREDQSGPPVQPGPQATEARVDLSSMTKAQLLDEADARGVNADESMTKAQIVEALEA